MSQDESRAASRTDRMGPGAIPPAPQGVRTSESSPKTSPAWLAAEWVLLLFLLGCVANWLLVPANAPHQPDFHHYFYPAGKNIAHGISPYEYRVEKDDSGFVYPPHLALILAPFCLSTPEVGATLWQFFNLALLAATLWLSERVAGFPLGWRRRAIVYLGLLLWIPIYDHFYLGSCTLIVSASAAGGLLAIQRNRLWLGGFLLAISAVKPHLVVLLGAGLVLRDWRIHRSVKLGAAGVLGVLASLALAYAAAPSWPASLMANQHDAYDYWGATTSIRTLLATPYGPTWLTEGIYWLGFLAAYGWMLYRWADRQADLVLLSAQTLAVTMLAAPYAHNYDYVLLILPLLLVFQRISTDTPWRRFGWFAGLIAAAWISSSFQRWFHSFLEYGTVWVTLEKWFGEPWVSQAWQDSKWKYRFTGLLFPLLMTVVLFRWPPRPARNP